MLRTSSFPLLASDRHPHVLRAHRLRGAAVAGLFRELVRWVSLVAR